MRESKIEKVLREAVESNAGVAYKFVSPGRRGVPDRLVLFPGGRAYFVELKAPGKDLEPHQDREIARIRRMGHSVTVIDSVQKAKDWAKIMGLLEG